MKYIKSVIVAFAALGLAAVAQATPTDTLISRRAKAGTPVVPGQWHAGFSAVKQYAEDNGLPLMAVWSNGDNCSHCLKFERGVNSATFNTWMKESGIVFYFGCDRDKGEDAYGSTAYNWCWKNQSLDLFPFVRFYWRAKKGTRLADGTVLTADKVMVDAAYTGDKVDSYKDNAEGSAKIKAFTLARFKQFMPTPPVTYYGGGFPFGNAAGNRLEAEVGPAKEIWIELARTNKTAVAHVATNYVVCTMPTQAKSVVAATTNRVDWKAGAATAGFSLALPALTVDDVDKTVSLTLLDEKFAPVEGETRQLTVVAAQPNSAVNPYFGEEKTAATLGYGEWTMNLDAVKGKVAKDGGYQLVLVQGSLWCPDCAAAEQNLWSRSEFTDWAKTNKVALGVVDIPNLKASTKTDSSNSPCLLTRVAAGGKSGTDYLSRHGITAAAAEATLARNLELAAKTVLERGLRRPESTNKDRIGVPTLVLLRADGSVAGRFADFAVKGPASFDAAYLKRFDELLARAADTAEESNDAYQTTATEVATQGEVKGTLSANDRVDWYKVPDSAVGSFVDFRLSGESDARVTLELVQVTTTGALSVLQTVTKALDEADFVVWSEKMPKDTYVCVAVDETDDPRYALTASGDSTVAYELESSIVLRASDKTQTYTNATGSVSLSVESGAAYLLQGVVTTDDDFVAVFDKGETDDIYVAKETTSVNLKLTANSLTYANWKTGRISFAVAGASVSETAGEYVVRIVRDGGTSGSAKVTVNLDAEKTTKKTDIFEFNDNGRELSWAPGDDHEETVVIKIRNNGYADGESHVFLTLTKGAGDAGVGIGVFDLRIVDDDKPVPGKLALRAVEPALAKAGVLIAKAGSTVSLSVCREGGTSGAMTGTLTASAGTPSKTSFAWETREEESAPVTIVAPASGSTTLTLKGTNGAKVDSSARTIKIQVVPVEAPEFEDGVLPVKATRYMAFAPVSVGLVAPQGNETVAKVSGKLPSGLSAKLTEGRLVVSGLPTAAAGVYTAVYQVSRGKTKGLTVSVTVTVSDPAVTAPGSTAPAVNPAVVKSRTISDIRLIEVDSQVLEGLVTLTIPRTGRLSAKLRSIHYGTVAFAAPSWSGFGADERTLEAVLTCTTDKDLTFKVAVAPDGAVTMSDFDGYSLWIPGEAFTAVKTAKDWEGPYNVSLAPQAPEAGDNAPLATGAGYVIVKKLSASGLKTGKVTYAGLLPNGKGVSGSTILTPEVWNGDKDNWDKASLAVVSMSSSDRLSTVMDIARRGASDTVPGTWFRKPVTAAACRWEHVETVPEASYTVDFEVYGTKYDKTEDFENCCLLAFETTSLKFFAVNPEALFFEKYGLPDAWQTTGYGLDVSSSAKTGNRILKQATGAAKGFTFTLDAANGLVSGAFTLPTDENAVPMKFKAVVMPGWGAASCTSCGGDESAADRPFVSGSAWADDVFSYNDGKRDRSLKIRRGVQVSVGLEAGR